MIVYLLCGESCLDRVAPRLFSLLATDISVEGREGKHEARALRRRQRASPAQVSKKPTAPRCLRDGALRGDEEGEYGCPLGGPDWRLCPKAI